MPTLQRNRILKIYYKTIKKLGFKIKRINNYI